MSDSDKQQRDGKDSDSLSSFSDKHSLGTAIIAEKSFGIRREELLTLQLSNKAFLCTYIFSILVGMFTSVIETRCVNVFVSYATNSYKQHSLLSTIGIVRAVIAAAALPAFARLSDLFGRTPLFLFALVLRIVGLIIMSQATNVNKYAGGMVLYSIGFAGNRILFQFNLQDASTLRYRLLSIAMLNAPVIITTWASGPIVTSLLNDRSWKFGIAMWAFVSPLAILPYLFCQAYMYWKARQMPQWKQLNEERALANQGKTLSSRFIAKSKLVFWKIDFIGCLLIILFLGFILVPLTLAGGKLKQWKTAKIIAPLVIGFCTLPVLWIWEAKFARHPLVPVVLLKDRGIWSAFSIGIVYSFVYNMPTSYSYPVLLVGMNADTTVATRTPQLAGFVNSIALIVLGFVLTKFRRVKGFVVFGALEWFIALGLFVHFRGDNNGIDGKYFRDGVAVAMCMLGFGLTFLNRPVSVSAQTCTNHEYMALVTSLFASLYQAGSAIGDCISGAIWTQTMFDEIRKKMIQLGVNPNLATSAYGSPYTFIKKYHWGSTERIAVVLAYAKVQRNLCIVGLCLCVPLLLLTLCLRDHYLADYQSLDEVVDGSKGPGKAEGQILFKNDDDMILNFLRRCVGMHNTKRAANTDLSA
ncbi:CIC11C00000003961 [Sungouiella intermedia]|uniref:CIC11C00000003961 n=1 Tax=Sungouiella intermedia TaxID=45354 RepID=A0A1L0D0X0_9ASCO|nr:CIC11C00000003961 [[Candida] intermedia]